MNDERLSERFSVCWNLGGGNDSFSPLLKRITEEPAIGSDLAHPRDAPQDDDGNLNRETLMERVQGATRGLGNAPNYTVAAVSTYAQDPAA